jgi:hypothetical protein
MPHRKLAPYERCAIAGSSPKIPTDVPIWGPPPPLDTAPLPCALPRSRKPLPKRLKNTPKMHPYRSHTCGALRLADAGSVVRLSGWIHRKRDHGGLLFVDLRDHYGLTQLVLSPETPGFAALERTRAESVVRIDGQVVADRRDRDSGDVAGGAVRSGGAAAAGVRRAGLSRRAAAEAPLSGFAARDAAPEHRAALAGDRLDPQPDDGAGVHRVPDADPDRQLARGGARLSGAVADSSGQVLCAAAGAARWNSTSWTWR